MRILLLIPAVIIELLALLLCLLVAVFNLPAGKRIVEWFCRVLPELKWYLGK